MAVVSWLALTVWLSVSLRFSWLVPISAALTVGILYSAAVVSGERGAPLFRILAVLYVGVAIVNIQFENLIFRIMRPGEIAGEVLSELAVGLTISAALAWASKGQERRDAPFRPVVPLWPVQPFPSLRIAALGALYVVLFLAAGSIIFPFVQSFYATSDLLKVPSFGIVVLTEFTRGIIHATAVIPLLQTLSGRRTQAAILAGAALSILGGVAALFLPVDDVFPFEIRRIHMVEILGCNFVFGVIVATALTPRVPAALSMPVRSSSS